MRVVINKSRAVGRVTAPPSKSMAHRLMICAALSDGVTRISGISHCDDVEATADCLTALGVKLEFSENEAIIHGRKPCDMHPASVLNCRESGSTLRFMIPIACLSGDVAEFSGAKRLLERPLDVYENLTDAGFKIRREGEKIFTSGRLKSGEFSLPGNVSSQFITGLMFALPTLEYDSRIHITTKIESLSYIELTRSAMEAFGVQVVWEDTQTLFIKGGQSYKASRVSVEGDYSASAFIDAFSCFGGDVFVEGLSESSLQGDRVYREHFKALKKGYAEINIEDCPDLAPILFTVAAGLHGGRFIGTKRLKIKESDRAEVMAEELSKFGACLTVLSNEVIVKPTSLHAPKEAILGHNDHRIVMSLAILLTVWGGEIEGAEAVRKSYPEFFAHLEALGIDLIKNEA